MVGNSELVDVELPVFHLHLELLMPVCQLLGQQERLVVEHQRKEHHLDRILPLPLQQRERLEVRDLCYATSRRPVVV